MSVYSITFATGAYNAASKRVESFSMAERLEILQQSIQELTQEKKLSGTPVVEVAPGGKLRVQANHHDAVSIAAKSEKIKGFEQIMQATV